jgi:hypothetical protein
MSDREYTYPSLRLRIFSFVVFNYFTFVFFGGLANIGFNPNPNAIIQFTKYISVALQMGAFLYFVFKLSKFGMTFRHFIFGYQVLNNHDATPVGIVKLYAREVVALVCGLALGFKLLAPLLLKTMASALSKDYEKHVVVTKDDNVYISNKNLGQLKTEQYNAELKNNMADEFQDMNENGVIHDRIFKTTPVDISRTEVLKMIFKKNNQNLTKENTAEQNNIDKIA